MTRQAAYEARRRAAGDTTVSARLTAEQAAVIKTAGGPTQVLRAIADAILAGGDILIVSGEGEQGTVEEYDGARTLPAIRQRHGARWARAQILSHTGAGDLPVYIDAETGEYR